MRVLIVGAGSTGGYLGGRLADAGQDVTFLVRPRRMAQLSETGLRIVSPAGDVTISPKLTAADALSEPYDLVILAVKGYALDAALADMAPAVGSGTTILPVLNGIRHIEILADRFGPRAVVGCTCMIALALDEQGRVVHLFPTQDLAYGEFDGRTTERILAIDAVMKTGGFNARLSPTIEREIWEKWEILAATGAVNCLMRGAVGEIAAAPGGPQVALRLLDEVVAVVRAAGAFPSDRFLDAARGILTATGSTVTTSMYRDIETGRRIEADQVIGDLLLRAQTAKIETPLLAAAYANLCVYAGRLERR
jgi:2-dehydropantoate 2-reductase